MGSHAVALAAPKMSACQETSAGAATREGEGEKGDRMFPKMSSVHSQLRKQMIGAQTTDTAQTAAATTASSASFECVSSYNFVTGLAYTDIDLTNRDKCYKAGVRECGADPVYAPGAVSGDQAKAIRYCNDTGCGNYKTTNPLELWNKMVVKWLNVWSG